jgi:hypothetical protein
MYALEIHATSRSTQSRPRIKGTNAVWFTRTYLL